MYYRETRSSVYRAVEGRVPHRGAEEGVEKKVHVQFNSGPRALGKTASCWGLTLAAYTWWGSKVLGGSSH